MVLGHSCHLALEVTEETAATEKVMQLHYNDITIKKKL